MVSICIPVYNYDVRGLAEILLRQIEQYPGAEILIADDASSEDYFRINGALQNTERISYIRRSVNSGRSRMRNLLAERAKNECLIFLDGDTMPVNDDFIEKYLSLFGENDFIFGGIKYRGLPPENPEQYLRWFYGKHREEISPEKRAEHGNRLFMTGNFCISKKIFGCVRFNESIREYGHEDTLFAYETEQASFMVYHTENPVYHLGLETGEVFLKKTLVATKNLLKLNAAGFTDLLMSVRLWRVYRKYRFIAFIPAFLFRFTGKLLEKQLKGKKPSLLFFDLYKLFALAYFNRLISGGEG